MPLKTFLIFVNLIKLKLYIIIIIIIHTNLFLFYMDKLQLSFAWNAINSI